jgi:hypothetical protein
MLSLTILAAGVMYGLASVIVGIVAVVMAAQRDVELFIGADSRLERFLTAGFLGAVIAIAILAMPVWWHMVTRMSWPELRLGTLAFSACYIGNQLLSLGDGDEVSAIVDVTRSLLVRQIDAEAARNRLLDLTTGHPLHARLEARTREVVDAVDLLRSGIESLRLELVTLAATSGVAASPSDHRSRVVWALARSGVLGQQLAPLRSNILRYIAVQRRDLQKAKAWIDPEWHRRQIESLGSAETWLHDGAPIRGILEAIRDIQLAVAARHDGPAPGA